MTDFSNTPDRYRPFGPSTPYILGVSDFDHQIEERNQLYYRQDQMDFGTLAHEIIEAPARASMTTYQYWAESGWKTEHGTYDSVIRFSKKTQEEFGEFVEATTTSDNPLNQDELVAEAGDVMWCLSALSSNGGISIDSHLKSLLYEFVRGIAHVTNGQLTPPAWRSQAVALATKWDGITAQDLDDLIVNRFEPTPSPVMNLEADEFFDEPADHLRSLGYLLQTMTLRQNRQFGYNDTLIVKEQFNAHGLVLGDLAARAVLELVFIVHHLSAGEASFSRVIQHNVQKISGRIAQQRIDKQDGERSAELL